MQGRKEATGQGYEEGLGHGSGEGVHLLGGPFQPRLRIVEISFVENLFAENLLAENLFAENLFGAYPHSMVSAKYDNSDGKVVDSIGAEIRVGRRWLKWCLRFQPSNPPR